MERVVRNRSFTLSKTFYSDGVATTPTGTPTIAIARADGTAVTVTVVSGSGVGPYTATVTAANNTLLDTLTVTWAATISGQAQTFADTVEVAGDVLFAINELSAELTTSTTTYTAAQIADARTHAETELESSCNIAFVPRFSVHRASGDGGCLLTIPKYGMRAVRWVTIAGVALTTTELAALEVGEGVIYGSTWTRGYGNIRVGYEHGLDSPPPGASEAALVLAKHQLVKGPIDERATQRASEFGPVNLATPGMFGSRFGIPSVDAFVSSNRIPVVA